MGPVRKFLAFERTVFKFAKIVLSVILSLPKMMVTGPAVPGCAAGSPATKHQ